MISNQPHSRPPRRASETRTPLNAVFGRMGGRPPPAPEAAPQQPAPPLPEPSRQDPPPPAAPVAAVPIDPPTIAAARPAASADAAAERPAQAENRRSLAATLLARAGAALSPQARPAAPPVTPPPASPTLAASVTAAAAQPSPAAPAPAAPPPIEMQPIEQATAPGTSEASKPPPPGEPETGKPTLPPEAATAPGLRSLAATLPRRPSTWRVPGWLIAPALKIAIPDSGLAWGQPGAALRGLYRAPEPADAEPATVGFAEPEAAGSGPANPEATPEPAVPAPPIEAAITEFEPAAVPEAPAEPEATPAEAATQDAAEAAAPAAAAEDAPSAAETLAAALRRGVASEPPISETAAEAARPLPRSVGEVRPSAAQLRAQRPLGAPQAAPRGEVAAEPSPERADGAGLPVTGAMPAVIEPETEPAAASETAVAPREATRPGDLAADRTTMRNRRLYRRVTLDADFEIDGNPATLLDISMGGFAAAKAPPLAPGAAMTVTLRLAIDGVDVSARMRARMVYCDDLHANAVRSGGRFVDLTASQTALLRYLVTWRGQSAGAIGTTTLLDAITRWPEQGLPSAPALPPPEPERRPGLFTRLLGWLRPRA